ncbi:inhibitor of KinA [Salsuginibacillus halophilus]|uniref:Inhibitor of KinA n=1 Tax=Salsuginibacillus halophilus TaxID=517424 RepID=A0A2P8HI32_9BACI|nr:5-oxoprolinase subunit PxpB [Salsuginibacillus halophilus]PSL45878.1 inhibitor of KinA [Salsuginibacillus halophilus]
MDDPIITPLGDRALRVNFGSVISEHIHKNVRSLCVLLEKYPRWGVIEWIPSYTSVTIMYDPLELPFEHGYRYVEELMQLALSEPLPPARTVEIPVVYGGTYGPDLDNVAAHNQISAEDVIHKHSTPTYMIYMLGFAPGFPYLGGLPEELATPRLAEPRTVVPAGAVGIAGPQTGIYPLESPGGWQIIGQTPLTLYRPDAEPPVLLQAGDRLQFSAVSEDEFVEISESVRAETYEPVIRWECEADD